MRMWNKTEKNQTASSRPSNFYNRILSMFLVFAIVGSSFAGAASAAEETVNDVYLTPDTQSGKLYVEDNSIILTAYANISGVSAARNVTEDATWSSTSTSVKVVKGVVTATGAVSSATITAKYKDKSDTFLVVSEYYYEDVKLKTATGDAPDKQDINLGSELKLTAWGTKGSSVNDDITAAAQWTTSNSAVATVSSGTVTLLTAGTVTITVKSKGKSDSIALTVESPYSSIDILDSDSKIIEGPIDMNVGADKTLKAQATQKVGGTVPLDETDIWSTSNAAIVKVEGNKLTAVGAGTAIVSAKRYGVTDSVTVIVRTEYEALRVTPDKPIYLTLYGTGVELKAEALKGVDEPDLVTDEAVWKISDADQAVAAISTKIDGTVWINPKGVGTAKINVSHKGLSKDISVTVFPTITTVEISKDSLDVFLEDTATLPAVSGKTVTGDSKDIGKLVEWSSSEDDVVAIEDGKWKALASGTVTLTAQIKASDETIIKDTLTINVHKKILTLVPSADTISVVIGKEVDLPKIQLIYEDGEEETISDKITWKSSTPNLLVKATTMKGLLPATATLTGTYLNKTVKIKVTVEEEFASFIIAPTKVSVTLKKSQTIKVTGITKSGKKVTLGSRIDWSASSDEHLTIKGASVKGLAEGSGKLTATVQGKNLEIPYVVTAKLSKLTASATSIKPAIGDQASIVLTALYENGKTANVTALAVWTTSKATVATVTDGSIKVIGKGSASIKGTFGGKSVTIRVSVK
ncbi:Ig-like domain-containing protein [Cohnella luojiensis]|uniref:Ig-like domain-containing protein n=1 Tax=Cohnella luojiensis TaxID=652876 RepID=UPI001F0E8462|nr:hypothetical protein [Cohnella luojiensis]